MTEKRIRDCHWRFPDGNIPANEDKAMMMTMGHPADQGKINHLLVLIRVNLGGKTKIICPANQGRRDVDDAKI